MPELQMQAFCQKLRQKVEPAFQARHSTPRQAGLAAGWGFNSSW